jgi:hypothetical protein
MRLPPGKTLLLDKNAAGWGKRRRPGLQNVPPPLIPRFVAASSRRGSRFAAGSEA